MGSTKGNKRHLAPTLLPDWGDMTEAEEQEEQEGPIMIIEMVLGAQS